MNIARNKTDAHAQDFVATPDIETKYTAGDIPFSPAVWSAAYIPDSTAAIQCEVLLQDWM